jgi:predicted nucleic acid-binding Zn ribbon protein
VKKLGDAVARELSRFGPAAGMAKIVEAWPGAVGPTIARNAWPARVARDGTLHIATSSSAWAFELGQLQEDILRRLRSAVGAAAPAKLRFAVGKLPEHGADPDIERRSTVLPDPTAEAVARGVELAAAIEDEELRKLVAKAAAQSLSRAR